METALMPEPENNPADELIVDYLDGEFCGWQLENTILSAAVHGYQVKVLSGKIRPFWRVVQFNKNQETVNQYTTWERPRIDLVKDALS